MGERTIADARHAVGNCNDLKACAIVERTIADARHAISINCFRNDQYGILARTDSRNRTGFSIIVNLEVQALICKLWHNLFFDCFFANRTHLMLLAFFGMSRHLVNTPRSIGMSRCVNYFGFLFSARAITFLFAILFALRGSYNAPIAPIVFMRLGLFLFLIRISSFLVGYGCYRIGYGRFHIWHGRFVVRHGRFLVRHSRILTGFSRFVVRHRCFHRLISRRPRQIARGQRNHQKKHQGQYNHFHLHFLFLLKIKSIFDFMLISLYHKKYRL